MNIENYELVVSGESEEKLLLTFDTEDLKEFNLNVSDIEKVNSVSFNPKLSQFEVSIQTNQASPEKTLVFVKTPLTLHEVISGFEKVCIVGINEDIELFSELDLNMS